MCMRILVIAILLSLVGLPVKATGQSGDIIRLEGEEWDLMAKPIGYDSLLYMRMKDFFPEILIGLRAIIAAILLSGRYVTDIFACNG